jgi:hypothetical protein
MQSKQPNVFSRFSGWFSGQRRPVQVGVGCAGIIGACMLCGVTGAVLSGTNTAANTTDSQASTVASTSTSHGSTTVAHKSATATPRPKPTATHVPATATPRPRPPTATPAPRYPAIGGNPWDYTLTDTGNILWNPNPAICNYLNCIPSFWDHTNGYVDECSDSTFSHSGGVRGDCSYHGGEVQPVYQP